MKLEKDAAGFVTLYDTVDKKELRVRAGVAAEILKHDQQTNFEKYKLEGPRFIQQETKKKLDFEARVEAEVARQLALHGIRSAPNRVSEKGTEGLLTVATGAPVAEAAEAVAESAAIASKIAAAVAEIKASATEDDPRVTDKGNPKKEAVEELLGFPISKAAFLAAIKG